MSKLSELKNHIHSLKEIKNIISAMKNLSLIELSKLNKYILPQNNVVTTIQEAISDFIAFNAYDLSFLQEQPVKAYILIGSERGFCGNFNEMIIDYFEEIPKAEKANQPFLLCVGRKLAIKMSDMSYVFEAIDGPNAVEEIQSSILNLVGFLEEIDQKTKGEIQPNNWAVVYNEESQDIKQTKIICPFSEFKTPKAKSFSFPPLLNIESNLFISEALDQYLFAILHQIFYKSFATENRQRLIHMDGAIRWLEKNSEHLILDYTRFRQEEITEEIEIILLSAKTIIDKMNLEF